MHGGCRHFVPTARAVLESYWTSLSQEDYQFAELETEQTEEEYKSSTLISTLNKCMIKLPPLLQLKMADPKAIFEDSDAYHGNNNDAKVECMRCGRVQATMKRCTKCRSAFYCSRVCFVKHWPTHREICCPSNVCVETDSEGNRSQLTVHCVHQENATASDLNSTAETITEPATVEDPRADPATVDMGPSPPGVEITLKFMKAKLKFTVRQDWGGSAILQEISDFLGVLPGTMRVIHKGRQLTAATVREVVSPRSVMQVIGEKRQDASGLNVKDIEVMMSQMRLTWNEAVGALRQNNGDLIDAMVFVGNKL